MYVYTHSVVCVCMCVCIHVHVCVAVRLRGWLARQQPTPCLPTYLPAVLLLCVCTIYLSTYWCSVCTTTCVYSIVCV